MKVSILTDGVSVSLDDLQSLISIGDAHKNFLTLQLRTFQITHSQLAFYDQWLRLFQKFGRGFIANVRKPLFTLDRGHCKAPSSSQYLSNQWRQAVCVLWQ